jgi:hypothetical protein
MLSHSHELTSDVLSAYIIAKINKLTEYCFIFILILVSQNFDYFNGCIDFVVMITDHFKIFKIYKKSI